MLRDREVSAADASIGMWALVAFNAPVWLAYGVLVAIPSSAPRECFNCPAR